MRALLLLPLAGCAPLDWREAAGADTSAGWLAYANAHPGTLKSEAAARKAEARGWDEAVAANTGTAYAAYLAAFPKGRHVAEATPLAIELGWAEANGDGTISALAAYAARWPQSPHAPEARARIEGLVWEQARGENTPESYGRYLAQYADGAHAADARGARDDLIWAATTPLAKREPYERYLEEFPSGHHAAEARAWLAASYVTRLQPLIALVATYQPPSAHTALLNKLAKAVNESLLAEVQTMFELRPIKSIDATSGMPSPQEQLGIEAGTGILVVEVHEVPGRAFVPSGTATDLQAVLRLYVPNTPNPVWVRDVRATTPDKVRGSDLSALEGAAIQELGNTLRSYGMDLASQAAPREVP